MKPKQKIEIETTMTVFERSVHRPVIISIEPAGVLTFRLKGLQRTYDLSAGHCYHAAVKAAVAATVKPNGKRRR
jgi:hypothetical protein